MGAPQFLFQGLLFVQGDFVVWHLWRALRVPVLLSFIFGVAVYVPFPLSDFVKTVLLLVFMTLVFFFLALRSLIRAYFE